MARRHAGTGPVAFRGKNQPRSLRAARSLSVPIVPLLSAGAVPLLGVVVDGVPALEPMLPLLGAVLSVVLGEVVVLGDVVVLGVELSVVLGDVVLGDVVLGDCVLGDCVPGDVALGVVLELESLPLVCAYTRPAPTASATPVLTAMDLNLLMNDSCLRSG
jgi:hypothetical protein